MKTRTIKQEVVMSDTIFKNFNEYWSLTKPLSCEQRNTLFASLSETEKESLKQSYDEGKWRDLFIRNCLDNILRGIKQDLDIDLLWIRVKVVSQRKCHYLKKSVWEWIVRVLSTYEPMDTSYILGGIRVEQDGKDSICLLPAKK